MVTSRAARTIAVTLLLIAAAPRSGVAADIEGVRFADQYQGDDVTLALHCVGLLRYKVLFKGYVAGLYLRDGVAAEDALDDVPKRLELSYFWTIKGSDFAKAGDEVLARNVDAGSLAQLRSRLEQINALYETVNPGDRYSLTYVPGLGTELALNGRRKGVIPGADFAAAYFRIWLGDQPIDSALRDQLLACPKTA
jgi:Chalcone isomerase-like